MSAEPVQAAFPPPESWLREEARSVKGPLLAAVGLSLGAGLLIIVQARLLATVCQRVVLEGVGLLPLLPLFVWLVCVVLLRAGCVYWSEEAAISAAATVKGAVRDRLHRRLLHLRPGGQAGEVGPLTELVTAGVEGLEAYIARFLPQLLLAGLLPFALLLAVFPCDWRASLVLIFSAPCIPLLMVLIGKGTEALNRRQFGQLARLSGYLLDLVQGLPDLKIFGAVKREAGLVAAASEQYRSATMKVLRVAFLSAFALEFFSTVGTAVIAVVIGFRLLAHELTLLDGLYVLLLAPEFYLPLRNLGLSYHSRMNGIAAAERITPLLGEIRKTCNAEAPGHEKNSTAEQRQPGTAKTFAVAALPRVSAPEHPPELVCESVTFRYGGERGGVQEVCLSIPSGSITALAGASGSGKSTLARLLLGLARPESGRVLVNGGDLQDRDLQEWRSRLAWVPQQPFFFTATIRENLLLGCPDADTATLRTALEKAALWPTVAALPDGLDTRLGDQGAGLSGGELRRLALARVLLRDARLVLLDEPTAGLDASNERLVLDCLQRLAPGRTLLVISHREEVVRRCTQVVELAAGRVQRITTPQQFLEGDGL